VELNPAPLTVTVDTFTFTELGLLRVRFCDELAPTFTDPNERLAGRLSAPTAVVTPVPVMGTETGEVLALLATEAEPLTAPAAWGVKVTDTLWFAPALIVTGKVTGESENPAPLRVMLETTRSLDPALVTTKFFELGTPTVTLPNARLEGDTLTELWGGLLEVSEDDEATPVLPHPAMSSSEKQQSATTR